MTEDHPILEATGAWTEARHIDGRMIATGEQAPGGAGYDVAIGTLLGDGHIPKKAGVLVVSHADDQAQYCKLKASVFGAKIVKRAGVHGWQPKTIFTTFPSGFFRKLRAQFYADGHKRIPHEIIENMSDLTLAIWSGRWVPAPGAKGTAAEICAADFEREDVAYAAAHMQKAMGFQCKISEPGRPTRIHFSADGSRELSRRIRSSLSVCNISLCL